MTSAELAGKLPSFLICFHTKIKDDRVTQDVVSGCCKLKKSYSNSAVGFENQCQSIKMTRVKQDVLCP
jgi:hypothetical protein